MQFTINAAALASIMPLCSDEISRPTLTGFLCRADGVLTGTDGHIAGARRAGHTGTADVIVRPNADLARMVKKATGKKAPSPDLQVNVRATLPDTPHCVGELATISYFGTSVDCDVVPGPFPNLAQVWPQMPDECPDVQGIGINPKLLARFGEWAVLRFVGMSRAIVVQTKDENFTGLIMPLRADEFPTPTYGEWLHQDKRRAAMLAPIALVA